MKSKIQLPTELTIKGFCTIDLEYPATYVNLQRGIYPIDIYYLFEKRMHWTDEENCIDMSSYRKPSVWEVWAQLTLPSGETLWVFTDVLNLEEVQKKAYWEEHHFHHTFLKRLWRLMQVNMNFPNLHFRDLIRY